MKAPLLICLAVLVASEASAQVRFNLDNNVAPFHGPEPGNPGLAKSGNTRVSCCSRCSKSQDSRNNRRRAPPFQQLANAAGIYYSLIMMLCCRPLAAGFHPLPLASNAVAKTTA